MKHKYAQHSWQGQVGSVDERQSFLAALAEFLFLFFHWWPASLVTQPRWFTSLHCPHCICSILLLSLSNTRCLVSSNVCCCHCEDKRLCCVCWNDLKCLFIGYGGFVTSREKLSWGNTRVRAGWSSSGQDAVSVRVVLLIYSVLLWLHCQESLCPPAEVNFGWNTPQLAVHTDCSVSLHNSKLLCSSDLTRNLVLCLLWGAFS